MKAYVIHVAEPWTRTKGSLLLLFKEFGYKIWLNPRQVDNYDSLTLHNPQLEQFILVGEDIEEMIRIGTEQRKLDLMKYKKGAKIN